MKRREFIIAILLLRCVSPVLALSGLGETICGLSAFRAKADMDNGAALTVAVVDDP